MTSLDAFQPIAASSIDGQRFDAGPRRTVARWLRSTVPPHAVAFVHARLPGLVWTLAGGKIERAVVQLVDWLAAFVDPDTPDPA